MRYTLFLADHSVTSVGVMTHLLGNAGVNGERKNNVELFFLFCTHFPSSTTEKGTMWTAWVTALALLVGGDWTRAGECRRTAALTLSCDRLTSFNQLASFSQATPAAGRIRRLVLSHTVLDGAHWSAAVFPALNRLELRSVRRRLRLGRALRVDGFRAFSCLGCEQ